MSNQTVPGPHFPECNVVLLGTSAEAPSIISKVSRALERYLLDQEFEPEKAKEIVKEFRDEAISGGYENVLTTAFRWVNVS